MKVKRSSQLAGLAVFALLLLPAAVFAEDPPPERGSVEFGVRYVWGDVYGRPDLQAGPSATLLKYNKESKSPYRLHRPWSFEG